MYIRVGYLVLINFEKLLLLFPGQNLPLSLPRALGLHLSQATNKYTGTPERMTANPTREGMGFWNRGTTTRYTDTSNITTGTHSQT